MRYQVPQFIDVEDKIFGPFSFRQFIYLAGSAGIVAVLVSLLPLFIGIILSLPVVALGLALAFYKINNKPFIEIVEEAFFFFLSDKLYLWKKKGVKTESEVVETPQAKVVTNTLSETEQLEKIQRLALALDVDDPNKNYG